MLTRLKALHVFLLLLMASGFAAGQVAPRVDVPLLTYGPNVPSSGGPLPQALFISGATVQVCTHPATLTSCTPITTYTDATLGTPCPSNAQLTQLPSTTCTASAGTAGNVGFWYGGGTVDYIVTTTYGPFGPFTVSTYSVGPYLPISGGSLTGPLLGPSISKIFMVDGSTYAQSDAGIQAAVNAAATAGGGTIFLASGTYSMCNNLPITIGNVSGIRIEGAGNSTILNVCSSLSQLTNIFTIDPTSAFEIRKIDFENFFVNVASGNPGNNLFYFEGGGGGIAFRPRISHVFMNYGGNHLNGFAIYADGTNQSNGNLRLAEIENNEFSSGIMINNAGDTLKIEHNMIFGSGNAIDVNYISGAADGIISFNNLTSTGAGIHLGGGGVKTQIIGNEIETVTGSVGSNGALIDIDGASGNLPAATNVQSNSCQIIGGSTLNCLRINYSNGARVYNNRFGRGSGSSTDITVTANAVATDVGPNEFAAGFPYSQMLSDSGTGTTALFSFNGQYVIKAATSITTFNSGGTGLIAGLYVYNSGDFTFGLNADCGVLLCINGTVANANGQLLPSTLTGYHGSASQKLQLSDGTGTNGNLAKFDSSGDVSDSSIAVANVPRYCGTATFTSSTTSSAVSCSWVTSTSHCNATYVGAPGGSLGFTASTGSVTLTSATSTTATANVYCSVN